jgi:hypothetical protein
MRFYLLLVGAFAALAAAQSCSCGGAVGDGICNADLGCGSDVGDPAVRQVSSPATVANIGPISVPVAAENCLSKGLATCRRY